MSIETASLTGRGNYFEDFNVGDVYEHARGKTVGEIDNVLITNLVMNTAQAHFNEHLMESSPQKHRITFGGVTASLVIGLAMEDTGENALTELGLDKIRFRTPVYHGDTLYAFTEVLAKQDAPDGRSDAGEVRFRHWGTNQNGQVVFEGERRVLVKRSSYTAGAMKFESAEETGAPAGAARTPKPRPSRRTKPAPKKPARRRVAAKKPAKRTVPAKKQPARKARK
jgi:acyl dehydratase